MTLLRPYDDGTGQILLLSRVAGLFLLVIRRVLCFLLAKHAYEDGVGEIGMISDPSSDRVNDVDLSLKLMQVGLVISMLLLGGCVKLYACFVCGLGPILMTLIIIHKFPDQLDEFESIRFLLDGFVCHFRLELLAERFRALAYGDVVRPLQVRVFHLLRLLYIVQLLIPHLLEIFDLSVRETDSFLASVGIWANYVRERWWIVCCHGQVLGVPCGAVSVIHLTSHIFIKFTVSVIKLGVKSSADVKHGALNAISLSSELLCSDPDWSASLLLNLTLGL